MERQGICRGPQRWDSRTCTHAEPLRTASPRPCSQGCRLAGLTARASGMCSAALSLAGLHNGHPTSRRPCPLWEWLVSDGCPYTWPCEGGPDTPLLWPRASWTHGMIYSHEAVTFLSLSVNQTSTPARWISGTSTRASAQL